MDLVDTLLKEIQEKENKLDLDRLEIDIDKVISSENQPLIAKNGQLGGSFSTNGNAPHTLQPTRERSKAPYDGLAVPLEMYWLEYYGNAEHTYEWNNGILEAKPMAILLQVKMYIWFLNLLQDFLYTNPIAEMTFLETGFEFSLPQKKQVRIPDLAIVLDSNPIPLGDRDNSYAGIFDICVESISTSSHKEIERDTVIKRGEYAQAGVQEYYILDELNPPGRNCETAFYRLGPSGIYHPILPVNGVIQSTVLPGFQFRIDDLERRPDPIETLDDSVYQGFTSPYLRAERERAEEVLEKIEQELEAERERAEKSIKLAEQAHGLNEQIKAYLKTQGISLPEHLQSGNM